MNLSVRFNDQEKSTIIYDKETNKDIAQISKSLPFDEAIKFGQLLGSADKMYKVLCAFNENFQEQVNQNNLVITIDHDDVQKLKQFIGLFIYQEK